MITSGQLLEEISRIAIKSMDKRLLRNININGGNKMAEIKFEIKEAAGTLSESSKGWKKELNLISWNDKEPKYDIRDWDSEHKKMGKGVTLTAEELKKLRDVLNGMEL
jgi:hypothetical protein